MSDQKKGVFPKLTMTSIALASFMDSFCFQIIVPNLPFAVKNFFPDLNDKELGYYYGYLISCYSLGGIFGSLFWGWYADNFGRRTSIISCLSCQMILSVAFGLSPNYYVSLAIRTLWGFTNGNLGVIKTYVSEVCSEDMQSLGFSVIVTMGGVANTVGPSLGGILGDVDTYLPFLAKRYPWIRSYPLFLPCLLGSVLSVIILIMVACTLKETLSKEDIQQNRIIHEETKKLYSEIKLRMKTHPEYKPNADDTYIIHVNEGSYWKLIQQHDVLWSCVIYGFYALVQGGQDALYPIWLILPIEDHGFDMTSSEIGWLYTGLFSRHISFPTPLQGVLSSIPMIFPQLTKLQSHKKISYYTGYLFAILLLVSPWVAILNTSAVSAQWVFLLLSYGFPQAIRFIFVTNVMVFITNSTFQDFRAKVNGLGQVMSAAGRMVGPSLVSNLFAFTTTSVNRFPIHYGTAFYVIALIQAVITTMTCLLPDTINNRKPLLRSYVNQAHNADNMGIEMIKMKEEEKENDQVGRDTVEEVKDSAVSEEKNEHITVLVPKSDISREGNKVEANGSI